MRSLARSRLEEVEAAGGESATATAEKKAGIEREMRIRLAEIEGERWEVRGRGLREEEGFERLMLGTTTAASDDRGLLPAKGGGTVGRTNTGKIWEMLAGGVMEALGKSGGGGGGGGDDDDDDDDGEYDDVSEIRSRISVLQRRKGEAEEI